MFYSEGNPEEEGLARDTEHFRRHLGPDVALLPNNVAKTNTYWVTERSDVNFCLVNRFSGGRGARKEDAGADGGGAA